MIDIEQHALRALEQDLGARAADLLEALPHRLGKAQHEGRDFAQFLEQRGAVHRRLAEACAQRVVVGAEAVKLGFERVEMRQIANADRAAADLVLVSRADAAPGGADLALACRRLAQAVQIAVERQDQRAVVRNRQILVRDRHALALNLGDLVAQRPGVEHHAVADHRQGARHDARRQQAELVGLAVDHQRVAGIVPALKAHHHIGAAGEPVDDLALALIAPLGADHGDVGHCYPSRVAGEPRGGLGG